MTIGESLRKFRRDNNLRQGQVANAIGILPQALYQYESGRNIPSAELIKKIAIAFDVSADVLLDVHVGRQRDIDRDLIDAITVCQNALQAVLDNHGLVLTENASK